MSIFQSIGQALGGAVDRAKEKNSRSASMNRVRAVIRAQESAAEQQYLALGRYYYNNLRDPSNEVTEGHCAQLDAIEARLDSALTSLEQLYQAAPQLVSPEEMEEVDLEDVQEFDADPLETIEPAMEEAAPDGVEKAVPQAEEETAPETEETEEAGQEAPQDQPLYSRIIPPAEPDENADLPFEG